MAAAVGWLQVPVTVARALPAGPTKLPCPNQPARTINNRQHNHGGLQSNGASAVYLAGDSSGATIMVETLLWLTDPAPAASVGGAPRPRQVDAAVAFSGWLDLSDSSSVLPLNSVPAPPAQWQHSVSAGALDVQDYFAHRFCGGECTGIGSASFRGSPGVGQLKAMCKPPTRGHPVFCHPWRMSPAAASVPPPPRSPAPHSTHSPTHLHLHIHTDTNPVRLLRPSATTELAPSCRCSALLPAGDAKRYAGEDWSIIHPLLSPMVRRTTEYTPNAHRCNCASRSFDHCHMTAGQPGCCGDQHADPSRLAELPPLMLIVGGAEQLVGENMLFAQVKHGL